MSAFPNVIVLDAGQEKVANQTKKHPLGVYGATLDGRLFRYGQAGAVALTPGLFTTVIDTPTNEQTVTVAHAIGTQVVTVTAAGIAVDDFKDGKLVVSAGTGAGDVYMIKGNTATASNVIAVTLYPNDKLVRAWSTGDTDVDLYVNSMSAQIICPVDGQQLASGLVVVNMAVDDFGWFLVKGLAAVMIDAAGQAVGLELDEKKVLQSLSHAGQGFIDTAPDATKLLAAHRQYLGMIVMQEDAVDNEMELVAVDLT